MSKVLEQWHTAVENSDDRVLKSLLHKDCTFYSPILFKPQQGKALTTLYLKAAYRMFSKNTNFHYIKEIVQGNEAVLEFNAEIEGIQIDGIDMISWDENDKITEFKVMIRPMKAIQKIGEKMMAELEEISLKDKIVVKLDKLRREWS